MRNKIIETLQKHGIELNFVPDLVNDLEFTFNMHSPASQVNEIAQLQADLKKKQEELDTLKNSAPYQGEVAQAKQVPEGLNDASLHHLTGFTLEQAKNHLKEIVFEPNSWKKGHNCLVCSQRVQLYYRQIDKSMAAELITLYKLDKANPEKAWFHVNQDLHRTAEASSICHLKHWGLVEQKANTETKADGIKNSGYWKITAKGKSFVENLERLPKKIKVFNKAFYGFDDTESVSITDCLGKKFNYNELMGNVI